MKYVARVFRVWKSDVSLDHRSLSRTESSTVAASSKLNVDDILEKLRTEIENS